MPVIPPDACCRDCTYSLHGLEDHRCPECGRPFNPDERETMLLPAQGAWNISRRVASKVLRLARAAAPLAASVAASWSLHAWHDGLLSLLFLAPAAFLTYRRRWFSALACLMLTPLAFAFYNASYDYTQGSREYVNGRDVIWHESGSVRPVTRVRGRHPGCGTRSMNSWVRSTGSDLAVQATYLITGPPPGAYTGPYPTQAQALAALSGGVAQQATALERGRVVVGNIALDVDPDTFYCHYMLRRESPPPPASQLVPTAALWRKTCLIVRVPRDVDNGPWADVYLFDLVSKEQFAMYFDNAQPAAVTSP
jgi:hypothetical protein